MSFSIPCTRNVPSFMRIVWLVKVLMRNNLTHFLIYNISGLYFLLSDVSAYLRDEHTSLSLDTWQLQTLIICVCTYKAHKLGSFVNYYRLFKNTVVKKYIKLGIQNVRKCMYVSICWHGSFLIQFRYFTLRTIKILYDLIQITLYYCQIFDIFWDQISKRHIFYTIRINYVAS